MFGGQFPFGGGSFASGFPGHEGAFGSQQKSDSTRYYKILGVDANASDAELKRAHRKLALKHHPDKGGDSDKFKEINMAYDVLRDPEKRKMYDEFGEDAIKEGMPSGPSSGMEDLFSMFTGGMGGRRAAPRERRGENVVHRLKVGLEEMYVGSTRKLSLARNIKCEQCAGRGTKSGKQYPCSECHGTGVQVMMRPLGPGMMQQIQQPCSNCRQTGFAPPPQDLCPVCSGKGLVPEKKVFEVHIEQGHKHGAKVVLRGEAGCSDPNVQPGDVVFVLEQRPHKLFKRVSNDLVMDKEITLSEALCGCSFDVVHLDNRVLQVVHPAGEVIKPDSWRCVNDEGMPVHGRPYEKGNLYIHFTVKFPDELDAGTMDALRKLLPPGAASASLNGRMETEDIEQVSSRPIKDMEEELRARRQYARAQSSEAYESSDEEDGMPRGQKVQCAQQ